jgi:GT2 family glycosyltransferase
MAVVHYPAVDRAGRPEVSVCIANYNGEQMLADCIDSILAQADAGSIEIIVHDDASTDGSVALLRSRYPQVEVLASESNVGFCVSNNRMVAAARGEFVLLLNNDAALFPDAIATLREAARANPSAILTLPQFDWTSGDLVDRGCLLDPFYNPVPNLDPFRRDVAYVIGACLWIPRSLWNELGGFPEWMGSIGEDMYLSCQARLRGHAVNATRDSGYRHWQGRSFGGNRVDRGRLQSTYQRRALSERNKTFVLFVMTPGVIVWPMLAAHLVALVIEGLLLAALRRDGSLWMRIYWPAIKAPLLQRTLLRAHRAREQAARKIELRQFLSTSRWLPRKLYLLGRHGLPRVD